MPKKTHQSDHIIPRAMRGKAFSSLSDLGAALGLKASENATPRTKNCRKCGEPMRNIPGTNVWVCDNMVEQERDGVKKFVPCGNRTMTAVTPRIQGSENPQKARHQDKPARAQAVSS